VFDFNALLHPGTIFDHPRDVLAHPSLSFRRNAPSLHPGHPTHRQSLPAPRCGHRSASRPPSPSTRFWKPCANSMAAPRSAWRQAEPPVFYVKGPGGLIGRSTWTNQITATRGEPDRASLGSQICEDVGTLPPKAIASERNDTLRSPKFSAALNQGAVPPRRSLLSRIRWMTYTI
jgi:hypothetical protein